MEQNPVKPERITKPIQLLGAWLAGLVAVDSCFLFAAAKLPVGSWEAAALVMAAILNVPLFLVAVFVLQTRFRPELQEDSYYSTYLSRRTNEVITVDKNEAKFVELTHKIATLEARIPQSTDLALQPRSPIAGLRIGINRHLTDRERVKGKLAEAGVVAVTTFGAESAAGTRVVAISEYLPRATVDVIAAIARDLGFAGYTMFDNRAEMTEEDVLFGSYGEVSFEFAATPNSALHPQATDEIKSGRG